MDEDEIREDGAELDGADELAETGDELDAGSEGEEGGADDASEDGDEDADELPAGVEEYEGEMASYEITGLVDYTDEGGNIVGQFPVGSIQELPTEVGDKAVEAGQATKVEASTVE